MLTRSSSRLLGAALVLTLPLAAGCTANRDEQIAPHGVAPPMKLVAFDSCDELLADMRMATRASIGPYGIPGNSGGEDVIDDRAGGVLFGGNRRGMGGPTTPAHSGTNNHEAAADEPDRVKTDGRRIVVTSGGVLRVIDAASRTETGKLRLGLGTDAPDLLLHNDHALVMAPLPSPDWRAWDGRRRLGAPRPWAARQQVLLISLTGTPKIISKYVIDGSMVDARMTDGTARLVIHSAPQFDLKKQPDKANLESEYRKLVDAAPVQTWQPAYEVTTNGRTEKGRVACDRISRPNSFSGTSMVTVLTFDVAGNTLGTGDPTSVAADGETVYSNGSSLYIATDRLWFRRLRTDSAPTPQQTEIHRFDTTGKAAPRYVASGSVPGGLINQYAMSEWDGHLRVATTEDPGESFDPTAAPGSMPSAAAAKPAVSSSAIRVLEQRGGNLIEVGKVGGLGKDEQIYAVRYVGPRGYVVTFRETDPLYSVDLSNPTKPTVTAELKITGYSSHLQPAGDGRLIGIGQEADRRGTPGGAQISLFNVANPAEVKRLAQHVVPEGLSAAEQDPHALLWWPATNLLVVPMSDYTQEKTTAVVLKVTDAGITELGEISQRPASSDDGSADIRRTLVVGDVLWTISDNGMQASSLSTLKPLGWLPTA